MNRYECLIQACCTTDLWDSDDVTEPSLSSSASAPKVPVIIGGNTTVAALTQEDFNNRKSGLDKGTNRQVNKEEVMKRRR